MRDHRSLAELAVIAGAIAVWVAPASAQQHRWDMPNEYSAASLPGMADQDFIRLVNEKSGGEIEITPQHGGASGYAARQHFAAVENGAVALASTYAGMFIGLDPVWKAQVIPFLATNQEESRAFYEAEKTWLDKTFRKAGQFLLFSQPWTPVGIWARRPITSVEALRGLRIRTFDANGTSAMTAAGASAVQLNWADVIPALADGTIDAVLTSDEGGVNASFWEHLDHFTQLGFTMGMNLVHMNLETFEALAPELQQGILDAAKEAEDLAWARTEERIQQNAETMMANGITVIEASDVPKEVIDHLRAARAPLLDEWRTEMGAEADTILEAYRNNLGT